MNFRRIIWNNEVTVFTDNKNNTFDRLGTSSRMQKWKIALAEFNLKYTHVKGKDNSGPDFMSRNLILAESATSTFSISKLKEEQEKEMPTLRKNFKNSFLFEVKEGENKGIKILLSEDEKIIVPLLLNLI